MKLTRQAAYLVMVDGLYAQAPRFFLWVPVWLGAGAAAYFSLRFEPGIGSFAWCAAVTLAALSLVLRGGDLLRVLAWCPLLFSIGFGLTAWRSHSVSAPKLGWHYYGAIEGRVVHLDRSANNMIRVTLADPIMEKFSPEHTPYRVRVALHSKVEGTKLTPGARIMLTGHLSPPGGPVEPGGFDFQRKAWYASLGAVGYTRAPPVLAVPPQDVSWADRIFAWRMGIADWLRAGIPGQNGAFAAAILAGDRSEIDPERLEDLRQSNLAHLLAISGLHMGLMTGFVFAVVRFVLATVPAVALRLPGKKIAAVVALLAGAGYLALSGASIATQRAFVMVAVMLVAVLIDRAAITLRAVATAATILIVLRPESLTEPGFQMSFAATTALVATFEWLNRTQVWHRMRYGRGKQVAPALSLFVASFVAAAATAPISAYHFNTMAQYGLIANMASVPVMSLVVMPAGVTAAVLAPLGLETPALWLMSLGIGWILNVATWVAGFPGSVIRIPAAPVAVLSLIMMGLLWVVIWRGPVRLAGFAGVLPGILLWAWAERPDILVTDNGHLVGIATKDGRVLSKPRGNRFAAAVWLENDGDALSQPEAAARHAFDRRSWTFQAENYTVAFNAEKEPEPSQLKALCRQMSLVILPNVDEGPDGCLVLTRRILRNRGPAAIDAGPDGKLTVTHVRDVTGERLWNARN